MSKRDLRSFDFFFLERMIDKSIDDYDSFLKLLRDTTYTFMIARFLFLILNFYSINIYKYVNDSLRDIKYKNLTLSNL